MKRADGTKPDLFPACAGVIPGSLSISGDGKSVPRMCGGDPCHHKTSSGMVFCSPHVRG